MSCDLGTSMMTGLTGTGDGGLPAKDSLIYQDDMYVSISSLDSRVCRLLPLVVLCWDVRFGQGTVWLVHASSCRVSCGLTCSLPMSRMRYWHDAKGRALFVVTPRRHVRALHELSTDEMYQLWGGAIQVHVFSTPTRLTLKPHSRNVYSSSRSVHAVAPPLALKTDPPCTLCMDGTQILNDMGCSLDDLKDMILNAGVDQNHEHLHLKVRPTRPVSSFLSPLTLDGPRFSVFGEES